MTLVGALSLALATTAVSAQNFDDPDEFAKQREQLEMTPNGPEGQPWLQYLGEDMADTSSHAKDGPYTFCFSNAGVNNPWRVVGFTNMQAEVEMHDEIENFVHVDAEGSDDKQIADIEDLLAGGECDVLIVSPNTTAALTPAVERACEQLPVIVFDRGVNTDCPVTFIHPIGGYAFGIEAAEFIADNVDPGANVLMLRILPGVDVLETRYSAGKRIFDEAGLNVVGAEFTDGDNAKTKSIVEDYLQRGQIDAVWMDAGATAVAAIEAFEDNGLEVPPFNGEDQQDFLQKWRDLGMTAIAPTYPTFQWRTPIIAALSVMKGEEVPGPEWVLPQPAIDGDNLADYINESMPPLHYAMCGCEEMPGYPERWGGRD
ncbi:substrate-binding domain-containing protein [Acuticoccus sp. M5D2P5]|uniref:substrate-binding domain-containing protein n=1 Tax=Acuticoccus kalidii TaxID=2910977 RepID=UPI001F1CC33A|nr:substrate-binding domain-containing protein [Acuticoccus kalidii]MCF3933584.1 substrate-binding domain-containing protein [Acuticoccus kalidii]